MDELFAPNGSPEAGPLVAAADAARLLIVQAIENNANGTGGVIQLQGRCCDCATPHLSRLPPGTFTGAGLEQSTGNSGPYVVGFDTAGVRLALEIVHTHAAADVRLPALQVPVIELVALDVLADPYMWRPVRDTLRARRCYSCRSRTPTVAPYVEEQAQYLARPLRRIAR